MTDLQVFEIDCPFKTFKQEGTQRLFGKFVEMKIRGFEGDYRTGILPLGAYDFISSLILICEKRGEDFFPLACFKFSSAQRAAEYNLPFELMGWFNSPNEAVQKEAVESVLREAAQRKEDVGYSSSWTIDPAKRQCRTLGPILKDLSLSVMLELNRRQNPNQEMMLGGVLRFKVDKVMSPLGFELLELEGKQVPPVNAWFASGEAAILMHMKKISDYGHALMNQYKSYWDNRIRIAVDEGSAVERDEQKAA